MIFYGKSNKRKPKKEGKEMIFYRKKLQSIVAEDPDDIIEFSDEELALQSKVNKYIQKN